MSEVERRFHEEWLGMVQPAEGLVVSVPVLVDAQCMEKLPREVHVRFLTELVQDRGRSRIRDLTRLFEHVLDLGPERFDEASVIPPEVSLYVPEGRQLLRPTRALRWPTPPDGTPGADATPAALAARPYAMLVWEVSPEVVSLDKPETVTGAWDYPVQAKMERLMRECRVPIGVLSNSWELRLVYAPHGESSGWIPFRVTDMASVSGRPIFDAFVMLLSRQRWFGLAPERQLPALLSESRKRNADVTTELSRQVFEALEVLLAGFAAADERDGTGLLRQALEREDEHLYAGLLAVLLRMVFLLYCENRALLPVENELFAENYSLLGLFEQLQADNGNCPDTMHRRFGAYPQLVSLFRAVFLGVKQGDLEIPARRGELFDPNTYPFLEGWGPEGSAPITQPEARAAVKVPSVDDLTVYTVLHKLLYLDGQRLSYKALDVEQIGSVYEALMGFDIQRLTSGAVRIKLGSKKGAARVWVEVEPLLAAPKAQRTRWLQDELGFDKGVAEKIARAVASVKDADAALAALEPLSGRRPERAFAGTLVVQPGPERRRTSSHYTPRELTEPIVARTLDPLIRAIGDEPPSETLLSLVICDPAMGSGAFLVAACRYLADRVVAAWTREGKLEVIADAHDDVVNHARRLVAQRCLYGVDKNHYAVQLARLSLWLVTMARNEPFTFVDHALRHGDSLVGLDFEQIKAFHWKPGKQVELPTKLLTEALDEAIAIRQRIQALAAEGTWEAQREKERLLFDADDALSRVRLIGDLVIGAFFAEVKDKARQAERDRRLALVEQWIAAERAGNGEKASELKVELRGLQAELRKTQVPFHWMIEFPEVFYAGRPDPLDGGRRNGAAWIDALVGDPPLVRGRGPKSPSVSSGSTLGWMRVTGDVRSRPGFHAVLGNPPWTLYIGKGSQPIDPREKAFLEAVFGRAAKPLSTHGLFATLAGRLGRPGTRVGLVLPTSVADAERYSEVRAGHDELCEAESELLDIGEGAFVGVFQPCMALVSTRRAVPVPRARGAPWKLTQTGVDAGVRELLAVLDELPKLPAELFGDCGYRSNVEDKGKFINADRPEPPFTVPLYEGASVREFELLPPTAFADGDRLPDTRFAKKWAEVDVFIRNTAKFPIASPSSRVAFRNSILAGFARAPYTTGVLLAYLNSTPVRWYHYHRQRDAQQGMPQVKVGHLRMLPAPKESALPWLDQIGESLARQNRGIGTAQREELDRVVADALGIRGAALERVLTWGKANPPPVGRQAPAEGPGVRKAPSVNPEPSRVTRTGRKDA